MSEVAILRPGSNASVFAIDGQRLSGGAWSLLPGRHEVWLRVRIYSQAPNMNWTIWSYCRSVFNAVGGQEYGSRVRTTREIAPGPDEKVKMEIGITSANDALIAPAIRCDAAAPELRD